MALSAIITVKLKGASEDQKAAFTKALAENNINKIPKIAATYEVNFIEEVDVADAKEAVEVMIVEAAATAKIKTYKAAFHIGEGDIELIES